MVNQGKPPLPPNRPYHQPLNYPKYVKDSNPNAHVRVFKVAIRIKDETKDAIFVYISFTLKDTLSDWCNNYMGD
jgi:hypothetical protein